MVKTEKMVPEVLEDSLELKEKKVILVQEDSQEPKELKEIKD